MMDKMIIVKIATIIQYMVSVALVITVYCLWKSNREQRKYRKEEWKLKLEEYKKILAQEYIEKYKS